MVNFFFFFVDERGLFEEEAPFLRGDMDMVALRAPPLSLEIC